MPKIMPSYEGKRVRVILEGIARQSSDQDNFILGDSNKLTYVNNINPEADHVVKIEVLPEPEVSWIDNDIVRFSSGKVAMRTSNLHSDPWYRSDGRRFDDDDIDANLITGSAYALIRGGKIQLVEDN